MNSENIHNKCVENTSEESGSYKEIFFNDHTVMLLIDPVTLRIVDANRAAINFYGYTPDEFVNLKISDINIGSQDYVIDNIQKSVSREKNHFIFQHQLANGEIRDVEVYSGLIKQNGKNVLYSIIHDITDNQLQNTLKRFYTILSSMYGATLLISDNSQVEFVNQAFCDFFNLNESPEELMGINDYEMIEKIKNTYLNPDEAILRIKEIISLKNPVKGEEVELKDGRTCIRDFIPLTISKKSYGRLWHHTDITDRKKAENKLKESENKFRTFFENIMDAVLLTIPDGTILAANPAAEKLFGYSEEEICKIGRNGLVDIEDPNLPVLIKERALNGKTQGEITFIRKDGTKFPGEMSTSVFEDGNGNKRTSMVIRDITKRKQTENKLYESEKLYRNIIDNIQDGFFRLDREGVIKMASPSLAFIYGFNNVQEMIGMTAVPLYKNLKDRKMLMEKLQKHGQINDFEIEALKNDGKSIWVAINAQFNYDDQDKIQGIDGFVRDITERKYDEQALRESEKNYRNIIGNIQDAYIRADIDGNIIMASPSAARMYHYKSPEEMIGVSALKFYKNPEDRNYVLGELNKHGKLENNEVKTFRKDGSCFLASQNAQFHYDDQGHVQGTETLVRDITKRKKAEKEIIKTLDELKRSNQELERFAYVSSHDLQEPLRMVTLYSQLLERRYKDSLDSDADDFIEYIVENAKRMKQLIDDLLEYSRVTSRAKEFEDVDLNKILDVVINSNLSIIITENNAKVIQDVLPTVFADENQMMQVFQNLITNAIKFRGKTPPEINLSARKGNNEWTFVVSDNGIGINPEHQKQIFEVFKRLHTREEYPGTGIGLSIVQKIIKHHGGRIWVESEPGEGSTFYFTIPAK